MMEPLGHPRLPERERVMARVTVKCATVEPPGILPASDVLTALEASGLESR
jgi:hypothetical protein